MCLCFWCVYLCLVFVYARACEREKLFEGRKTVTELAMLLLFQLEGAVAKLSVDAF